MIEIPIYGREVIITEDMEKILKIFDNWGITPAFCDSDLIDISLEILKCLKRDKE
jgi:hypothetical protein